MKPSRSVSILLVAASFAGIALAAVRIASSDAPLLGPWEVAIVGRLHEALGPRGWIMFAPVIPAQTLVIANLGCIAALAARGDRRRAFAIAAALLASQALSLSTKRAVALPRPYVTLALTPLVAEPPRQSFPSGHAALAGILAAALGRSRRGLAFGAAFVAYVMVSRVGLAMHHPSDVVAGATLGIAVAVAVMLAAEGLAARATDRRCANLTDP